MLIYFIVFSVCTVVIEMTLLFEGVNPIIAGVISFVIFMTAFSVAYLKREKKRSLLLNEACDPEAFLRSTEKQEAHTPKNFKTTAFFTINKSAALITLGECELAKNLLQALDRSKFSEKDINLVVYTINLIVCYYELGDIPQAEHLFETQIPVLAPILPSVKMAVNILVGERFYFLGRYDESRAHLRKLLEGKLNRRAYLSILFRLAQIDEIKGDIDEAKEKYIQVAEQGNKLCIVEEARKRLRELT